jgi:hypothetical protein
MKKLTNEYHRHGISFLFPAGWELSEESQEDAQTVTVSDQGPFWSVTILKRRPRAEHVMSEAIEAFQSVYDEIDEYTDSAVLLGEPALARNLEFVSMELINCVYLRALEVGGRTLFVMAQVTDHERNDYDAIFAAISASLKVDDDSVILIE